MSFQNHLNWRHATKTFDPNKKISAEKLSQILDSIRMTPTSFGLQPFELKIITDQTLKDQIQPLSWNQPQIGTCSHLLVFCANTDVEARIDDYLELASGGDEKIRGNLAGYETMMRGFLSKMSPDQILSWSQKQTYIALGFAMAACAELEVDSCPMEGFLPKDVDELLALPAHLKSTVLLPVGVRASEPEHPKVRFSAEKLFQTI